MHSARSSSVHPRLRATSPWVIFSIALLFRVAVGIRFFLVGGITYQWSNEVAAIARSLVLRHAFAGAYRGYGGPTAWLAPGYPFVTAAVFRIFGINSASSGLVLLLINALFASFTAVLVYHLGRDHFSKPAGLLGAWLWALSPVGVLMPLLLWDTSISAFLLAAGVLLLLRAEAVRQWAAAGLVWGVSALFSPALLAPLALILAMKLSQVSSRKRAAIAFCASMLLVLLPWSLRNYLELHALFPVRSNGWAEIYFGNVSFALHPCARPDGLYQRIGETPFVHQLRREVVEYVRSSPGDFLRKSLQRAFRFWLVPFAFLPFTGAFAALSLAGGVLLIRDRRLSATGILAVPILYPLIYSITHIETRYRHPIEPVLCLLSAYGLCELLEYARVAKKWTGESSKREKTGAVSGLDLIADVQTGTRSPELPRRPEATNPLT